MNKHNLCKLVKSVIIPLHRDGVKFVLAFAVVTILFALVSSILGVIGLVLTLWCAYFFRDPERFSPEDENLIISPADGVVNSIEEFATPPAELELDKSAKWTRISIFLNVFNVHVNRIPHAGEITQLNYQVGEFLSANLEECSHRNERYSAVVRTKNGQDIIFVQIAGLVARRIVCYLTLGQKVKAGERYGLIRFGSRADVYVPQGSKLKVLLGQTMIGGETILAELKKSSNSAAVVENSDVKAVKKVKKTAKKSAS